MEITLLSIVGDTIFLHVFLSSPTKLECIDPTILRYCWGHLERSILPLRYWNAYQRPRYDKRLNWFARLTSARNTTSAESWFRISLSTTCHILCSFFTQSRTRHSHTVAFFHLIRLQPLSGSCDLSLSINLLGYTFDILALHH